jgi:hypothetical protein
MLDAITVTLVPGGMLGVTVVAGVGPDEKKLNVQVPVWFGVLKGSAEVFEIVIPKSNRALVIATGKRRLVPTGWAAAVVFQLIFVQVAPELGGGQLVVADTT